MRVYGGKALKAYVMGIVNEVWSFNLTEEQVKIMGNYTEEGEYFIAESDKQWVMCDVESI